MPDLSKLSLATIPDVLRHFGTDSLEVEPIRERVDRLNGQATGDEVLSLEDGIRVASALCRSIDRSSKAIVWRRWQLGVILYHCGTVYGESTVRTFSRRLRDAGFSGVGTTNLYYCIRLVRKLGADRERLVDKVTSGELATWSKCIDFVERDQALAGEDPSGYTDRMLYQAETAVGNLQKANEAAERIEDPDEREAKRREIDGVAFALHEELDRARESTFEVLHKGGETSRTARRRLRSEAYLDRVRRLPCSVTGVEPPSTIARYDAASDWTAFPLTPDLARLYVESGDEAFFRETKRDPGLLALQTIAYLRSGVFVEY